MEGRLFRWLKQLFGEQEGRVLKELNQLYRRGFENKALEDIIALFDFHTEVGIFQLAATEMYTNLISERGRDVFEQLEVGLVFNISDINVQQALQNLTMTFSDFVNRTTQEQLRRELSEAISEGEGIPKIRKRVQKVFDGTVRGSAYRSQMIARTETISIANGGSRLAYKQSGVVEMKEWLSSRDDRVRPSHVRADGQVRRLNEAFMVGGFRLDYPGDPDAPPQERIHCRCAILPVLK